MKRSRLQKKQLVGLGFSYVVILFMLLSNYTTYLEDKDFGLFLSFLVALSFALFVTIGINIYIIKKGSDFNNGNIYVTELDLEEKAFLKSGAKKCPVCANELIKVKQSVLKGKGVARGIHTTIEGNVYKKETVYKCETCNKEYTIKQLMST